MMIGDKNYDDMNTRYAKAIREAEHREYLEYQREIMEMDEQSAAREAEKEED